jgi:glycosyltransferase involved in cell wall biosynthesis
MPHNVLHTITGLNVGGAERMLLRFLSKLDPTAWPSSILSLLPPGPLQAEAEAMGTPVRNLSASAGRLSLGAVVRLRARAAEAEPDLVHGWMYHGNFAGSAAMLTRFRRKPVIWSIHHSLTSLANEKPMTRLVISMLSRLSSHTHAISYCSMASATQHEAVGFDPRRRVVIPNGIDCAEFQPAPGAREALRAAIGAPEGRLIIGHVARWHPMKDQTRIIEVVKTLTDQKLDVHAVIIGEGHAEGPVRAAAREMGVDDRVSTLGVRNDVPALAPGFDLYLLTSKWGEAFPLAVGEAMACGVPAVVTDVGDCAWLAGDPERVAPPGDSAAIAAACAAILQLEPDARRRLGLACRNHVIDNFGIDNYVRRHLDLYEMALAGEKKQAA